MLGDVGAKLRICGPDRHGSGGGRPRPPPGNVTPMRGSAEAGEPATPARASAPSITTVIRFPKPLNERPCGRVAGLLVMARSPLVPRVRSIETRRALFARTVPR